MSASILVWLRIARPTVKRRRHKLHLDLVFRGVLRLGGAESLLDSIDALVAKASDCVC
jgi:hypothetical protein